jgi:hypothetical protein
MALPMTVPMVATATEQLTELWWCQGQMVLLKAPWKAWWAHCQCSWHCHLMAAYGEADSVIIMVMIMALPMTVPMATTATEQLTELWWCQGQMVLLKAPWKAWWALCQCSWHCHLMAAYGEADLSMVTVMIMALPMTATELVISWW